MKESAAKEAAWKVYAAAVKKSSAAREYAAWAEYWIAGYV